MRFKTINRFSNTLDNFVTTAKTTFTSYLMNSVFEASDVSNEDNDGLISSNKERSGIDLTSNPVICSPIFVIKSVARTTLKS